MRLKVSFWLGIAGSLLIVALLILFAPAVKKAYRTAEAIKATAESQESAPGRAALSAQQSRSQPGSPLTPTAKLTPGSIPNTGSTLSSALPTLVYLLLIAAVLLLTGELLVLTRPKKE